MRMPSTLVHGCRWLQTDVKDRGYEVHNNRSSRWSCSRSCLPKPSASRGLDLCSPSDYKRCTAFVLLRFLSLIATHISPFLLSPHPGRPYCVRRFCVDAPPPVVHYKHLRSRSRFRPYHKLFCSSLNPYPDMKFATAALSAAALLAASVSSVPVRRDVPVDLVPQFGIQANVNPTGTGSV